MIEAAHTRGCLLTVMSTSGMVGGVEKMLNDGKLYSFNGRRQDKNGRLPGRRCKMRPEARTRPNGTVDITTSRHIHSTATKDCFVQLAGDVQCCSIESTGRYVMMAPIRRYPFVKSLRHQL